jgi:tripartite-type tricarboxylate transporter receptor subunit TctC
MKKLLTTLAFAITSLSAQADIKIIVPFAAGGAIDIVARHFAAYAEKTTGSSVRVENVTGAGSTIGTRKLLESSGNIAMINSSSFYVNIAQGTFSEDEFKLASTIAEAPMFLAVPASKKLTCEILRNTDKPMFIGSAGKDSITSVPTKFVTDKFSNYTDVPYKGVAQALVDLIAARLDVVFLASKLDNPQLEILANTSLSRYEGYPSIKECLGIDKSSNSQWVIVTNKTADDAFVKQLNSLALQYVKDPATVALFKTRFIQSAAGDMAVTRTQYSAQIKSWNNNLK